ncbi:hypothetical protein CDAR_558191 [Caerostris darwini]|uniref:Uncharacterized protein n=1 Tax=Caerostris darwini TaxID=1538125 RepID=A0AAV4R804_9ARAC|nr:hypothetical protein CDAR_558191 [Caerostris darwini]
MKKKKVDDGGGGDSSAAICRRATQTEEGQRAVSQELIERANCSAQSKHRRGIRDPLQRDEAHNLSIPTLITPTEKEGDSRRARNNWGRGVNLSAGNRRHGD